jgi:hypothetical protein
MMDAMRSLLLMRSLVLAVSISAATGTAGAQWTTAQVPDGELGAILAPFVFDSLRGGGMRADSHWIAADSLTFRALGVAAKERRIHL